MQKRWVKLEAGSQERDGKKQESLTQNASRGLQSIFHKVYFSGPICQLGMKNEEKQGLTSGFNWVDG